MDADVVEARVLLQLILVGVDDPVGGIRDVLVVEAPPAELGAGRAARGKGDVVALPRVGVHVLDLPLRVVAEVRVDEVARARIDLRVREGTCGAGERIDEVPALRRLPPRQDFTAEALGDLPRWARNASARRCEEGDVRVADDRHAGLRLQVHPVDVLAEVELAGAGGGRSGVGRGVGAELPGIPRGPRAAQLIDAARVSARAVVGIAERSRRAREEPGPCRDRPRPLRQRPQPLRVVGARSDDVRLIVENEQVRRRPVLPERRRLEHLDRADLEELCSEHVVDGEQRRRHASRA